jgi:hypothetical protein
VETFTRIHARFMIGRTRLSLAQLAHARRDAETAARHLGEAHALFRVLHVPYWLDRTTALGQEWSVPLADEAVQPALAVVRRGEAELFEMLRAHLDALNLGGVIWDRRVGERRRRQASRVPDRRGEARRRPLPTTWDTLGFLLSP